MIRRLGKIFIIMSLILIVASNSYANDNQKHLKYIKKDLNNISITKAQEGRIRFKKDNKHGYLDYNGEVVIKAEYKYANDFKNGVAKVFQDDKGYFYINKSGEVVFSVEDIKEKLEIEGNLSVEEFQEGLAKVSTYRKVAYINTQGEIVVPFIYTQGRSFSDGLAYVSDEEGKYFINKLGEKVITINKDDQNYYYDFKNGLAKYRNNENYKYGFIDKEGQIKIEANYDSIDDFSEGYAVFEEDNLFGMIDQEAKVVIEAKFKSIGDFSDGITFLYDGVYTVFLNHDFKPVYQLTGYYSRDYDNDFITLQYSDGLGVVDKNGHLVDKVSDAYQIGDGFILEDKKNILKVQNLAQKSSRVDENIDIYKNYNYIFVNQRGEEVINLNDYDEVFPFHEGRARVKKDNLYGFIDKKGELVISIQYLRVSDFAEGKAVVYDGQSYYKIDRAGAKIEEERRANLNSEAEDPYQGSAIIIKKKSYYDKSYGLVDQDNELILKPIYDSIRKEEEGIYYVKLDRKKGFYNVETDKFVKPSYTYLDFFFADERNYIVAKKEDSKYGVLNYNGELMIPLEYDYIWDGSFGFINLRKGNYGGLADNHGNLILDAAYSKIYLQAIAGTEEYISVSYQGKEEEKQIIVNKVTGEKIVLDFNGDVYSYSNGIFLGSNKDTSFYIARDGKIIFSVKGRLTDFGSKYGIVFEKDNSYLVDRLGEVYVKDNNFSQVYFPIVDGHFIFKKDNYYGIADINGQVKTTKKYGCISDIQEGIATACFKGNKGYLNLEGEEIVEFGKYQKIHSFSDSLGLVVELQK
ncbi:WG repeat-containing protein [Orenia marismortui]|uniref:WG repeat-containing protein n=1 Tax=Orenia marismortui TaxID=46469 RepID=UPI000373DC4E|nr:WG repeat-containing protein [Orenia marismortui]